MQRDENITEIEILLQKKYKLLNDFLGQTKELAEAMSRNDDISVQMLFEMRQESMDDIDVIDKQMFDIIDGLGDLLRNEINNQLVAEDIFCENEQIKNIGALYNRNYRIVERIIEIDKVLNKKIGGEKSFYK